MPHIGALQSCQVIGGGGCEPERAGKVLLQGAEAGAAVLSWLLLELLCCQKGALDGAIVGEGCHAAEVAGGEAGPMEGEGGAAKFSVRGGGEGGGVHASDAAEEAAVESFGSVTSYRGAGGKGPDFGGIGEDGGDEGVEEAAHEGWCGDAKLGAAEV